MTNPLSLHHLTMSTAHPLELVDAAAAGGFEFCGMRLTAPTPEELVADVAGDEALIRRLERRLDDTGVRLLDIETARLLPSTDVGSLAPALETGRRLGARYVVASGPDPDRARLVDNLSGLCRTAAGLGMSVAFEFHSCYAINTIGRALDLIEACRAENLVLLVDILHLVRTGGDAGDVAQVDPRLLHYAQICDAVRDGPSTVDELRAEARTDRRLLGEGELQVDVILAALPPGIPYSVETPTTALRGLPYPEQARIVAKTTRRFLERLPPHAVTTQMPAETAEAR